MNEDEAIQNIYKKIQRENALLNAANAMRAQTNNEAVRSRLDSQMRDGRRNLQFFEEKLRELQMRKMNQGLGSMSLAPDGSSGRPRSADMRNDAEGPPAPPPKDAQQWGDRGSYGSQQYSQIGGQGDLIPPRHPYAPPSPASAMPKPRPNFTKLGPYT
jgi:hypothetical protein